MFGGEALRTLAHKIHMRTLGQNLSRRPHWIAHPLHAPDTPGPQRRPIHDERIQLHLAVAIQEATAAGVEGLVVFHDDNGFLDSIKRRATTMPSGMAQAPPWTTRTGSVGKDCPHKDCSHKDCPKREKSDRTV